MCSLSEGRLGAPGRSRVTRRRPRRLVTVVTPTLPFLLTASDSRFGLYAGSGSNNFIVGADIIFATRFGGTLTQVITTSVPEAATWALMIGGFGGVGAAMRRRRATLA